MAGNGGLIVVWPKVRVFVDGERKTLERGAQVPELDKAQTDNLVSFGAIAGALVDGPVPSADADAEGDAFDPEKGGNIEDTMAYVGGDVDRAKAVLAIEEDKAKPRPKLVEQLNAVIDPQS